MSFTVQHKRSSVEGRRPQPADLQPGQVGVNDYYDQPGAFIKTSSDTVVKLGPVYIGTSAPTLEVESSYCVGELWLDITANVNQLNVWDGAQWRTVST